MSINRDFIRTEGLLEDAGALAPKIDSFSYPDYEDMPGHVDGISQLEINLHRLGQLQNKIHFMMDEVKSLIVK